THLDRELDGVEDRLERVARKSNHEERKRVDVELPQDSYLFLELVDEDRLPVHPLLDARVDAFDAKIDPRAAGTRHRRDCRLVEAVDARLALPGDLQAAPDNLVTDLHDPLLLHRE